MIRYTHPRSIPHAAGRSLKINGLPVEVLSTDVADFAIVALEPGDFPARVEAVFDKAPARVDIRPLSAGVSADLNGASVEFVLNEPRKLSIDPGWGTKPIYLFAGPPERSAPAAGTPGVITFPAGQVTELPRLDLQTGQTLYLPGGSVLKTRIHTKDAAGVRICGHGIFDGSFYDRGRDGGIPSIVLERCHGVLVEDITMVRPQAWMILLGACRGATVRNVRQIGEVMSSDGIDVVGSSNVLIEDCFLHNNDDCVVVKAFDIGANNLDGTEVKACENVEDVEVRRCVFANWMGGNGMEIGHELSAERVSRVSFRDIDVLHVHGQGAVFSIHNFGRALVEDVLFEDIRIEHCFDKLIDFRISRSRFSTDAEYGRVRGVVLRDIHWHRTPYNAGYTTSMIGGRDAVHEICDVVIENFRIDGRVISDLDELEITTRHCRGLELRGDHG